MDSKPQSKYSTEEIGDAKEESPERAYWLIGDGDGSSDDRPVGPVLRLE